MVLNKNYTRVPNAVFQSGELNLKAIGLYAYLMYRSYCGNGEIAYPSQKRIMEECKIGSDNTLRKIIFTLKEQGFLEVKRGSTYTGNSLYKLSIPRNCGHDSS